MDNALKYVEFAVKAATSSRSYITDEDGEETGEDVTLDDSWNYTDILWNGIQAEKVPRAFE